MGLLFCWPKLCKEQGSPGSHILALRYWAQDLEGSTHFWLSVPFLGMTHSRHSSPLAYRTAYLRHFWYPVPWSLLFSYLTPFQALVGPASCFLHLDFTDFLNCRIKKCKTQQRVGLQVCLHIASRTQKHISLETKEIRCKDRWLLPYHPAKKVKIMMFNNYSIILWVNYSWNNAFWVETQMPNNFLWWCGGFKVWFQNFLLSFHWEMSLFFLPRNLGHDYLAKRTWQERCCANFIL